MIKIYYPRVKSLIGVCALALSSFLFTSKTATGQTITAVTPSFAIPGATVTITGTGFNTTAASNAIYFGGVRAVTPTAASATSLTVTVPVGASNSNIAVVNLATRGWVMDVKAFIPEYMSSCFITGAYNFKPKVDFASGTQPFNTGFADLDGDGKLDMVIANHGTNTVSIYRNTSVSGSISASSFTSVGTYTAAAGPSSIRFADLDRDGKIDIIIACDGGGGAVSIARNTSTIGNIVPGTTGNIVNRNINTKLPDPAFLGYGGKCSDLTVGDFDGDGKPDVAAVVREVDALGNNVGKDSVKIFMNVLSTALVGTNFPTLTFSNAVSFALAHNSYPYSISSADFDGDGKVDIVTANQGDGGVSTASSASVLRNSSIGAGSLSFDPYVNFGIPAGQTLQSVNTIDVDGDGKKDILATSTDYSSTGFLHVFRCQASSGAINSGSFPSRLDIPTTMNFPIGIATGDIDGDGMSDVVVGEFNFPGSIGSVEIFSNTSISPSIALASTASFTTGTNPVGISVADVDGDTKPDMIAANSVSNNVSIFRNYPLPVTAPITGPATLCVPNVDTFRDAIAGGTWTVFDAAVATVDPVNGAVTPLSAGSDTVYYRIICNNDTATLLRKAFTVGLFPVVAPITGTSTTLCTGSSMTLSDATPSGTWSSSAPLVATVVGGAVTGLTSGSSVTITYSLTNSCGTSSQTYGPLTIYQSPAAITGTTSICTGASATLSNTVPTGTWSSNNLPVATITTPGGVVHAVTAGTATISYTMTGGCYSTALVTVSATPTIAAIAGPTSVCTGNDITLTDATTTGVWSSSDNSKATVSSTGMVHGIASGPVTITYSVTTGCGTGFQTYGVTVNQSPAAITGTTTLCAGLSTTLNDATPTGAWSSNNLPVATVSSPGGVVHAVAAGTATISYTMAGGCSATALFTVNAAPVVAAIGGPTSVCTGSNITLTDATATGTWSSSDITKATVSASGMVHGIAVGTINITYTVTNSCGTNFQIYPITVNQTPAAITGTFNVCPGSTVSLFNTSGGGTWASTTTAAATVTTTGGVGGVAGGSSVISYTLTGGCYSTATVTVYNAPAPISGGNAVCVGSSITLTDASAPGTWSQTGGFVSIGATTGVVTGLSAGNATISFTQTSTGCSVALTPFTVNNVPSTILGGPTICRGAVSTLTSSPAGGTWSATPFAVATIDAVTGAITGNALGIATVSYTIPSTGCATGATISVFPSPGPITGSATVCLGGFTNLADTPSGGIWSSSNSVVAPVNAIGIVSGATLGTTTITYAIAGSSCIATHTMTVTAPPAAITGISTICPNVTLSLNNTTGGGTWSSSNNAVASIDAASGLLTGVSGGSAFISYTLSATGCFVFSPITINPGPTVTGPTSVCQGFTSHLIVDSAFGYWTSSDTTLIKVDSATGIVHGVITGPPSTVNSALITFTTPGFGCTDTMTVTSYPIVAPLVSITPSPTLTLAGGVATVCQNTLVTYTTSVINGGPSPTFQWVVNSIPAGTGGSFSYIPLNGDSVTVIMTSNANCPAPARDTDHVKMVVITRKTPILNLATGMGDTTCLGNPVTLNPNTLFGGAAPTYNWMINGINVGPGSTFTYVPANNDFIKVTVHSNYICPLIDTAVDTLRLTVSPFLNPTITIVGSDTACEGYPIAYTTVMSGGGTAPTYQWRVNGINAGTAGSLAYMANTGDVVDVTMTSNFPCVNYSVTTSAPRTVTVIPVAIPDVTMNISPGYILAPGMTATFTAIPVNPGAAPTYIWKKNGVLIPGANTTVYSTNVLATGDSFTVVMTNHDLCNNISVYASREVSIGGNVGISVVNGPNSDVRVVPNPTKGKFVVRGDIGITTDEEVSVEITNMVGQVVYRNKFNAVNGSLDHTVLLDNELANGMYLLNIHSEHLSKTIHFELGR